MKKCSTKLQVDSTWKFNRVISRTYQSQQSTENTYPPSSMSMRDYEFGGPAGALATMGFLPIITLLLTHWASVGRIDFENILPDVCLSDVNSLSSILDKIIKSDVLCPSCTEPVVLISCALVIIIWFLFQVVGVLLSWLHHYLFRTIAWKS